MALFIAKLEAWMSKSTLSCRITWEQIKPQFEFESRVHYSVSKLFGRPRKVGMKVEDGHGQLIKHGKSLNESYLIESFGNRKSSYE